MSAPAPTPKRPFRSRPLSANEQRGRRIPLKEASGRRFYTVAVQYRAQKTGQIKRELKVHELKADNRAVCGNSRRQPMVDRGPGTVTCASCARDTGR